MMQALTRHGSTVTTCSHMLVLLLTSFLPCLLLLLAAVGDGTHAKAIPDDLPLMKENCSVTDHVTTDFTLPSGKYPSSWSQEEKAFVEGILGKILEKLGWSKGRPSSTISKKMPTKAVRERIKEFMSGVRQRQEASGETESSGDPDGEKDGSEMTTRLYGIAESSMKVPVHRLSHESTAAPLNVVKFQTEIKHPENPQNELFIKSAILRLKLLPSTRNPQSSIHSLSLPLILRVYWLHHTEGENGTDDTSSRQLLKSFTIHDTDMQTLTLDVQSLLSQSIADFEDNHRPVRVGVTVEEVRVPLDSFGTGREQTEKTTTQKDDHPSAETSAYAYSSRTVWYEMDSGEPAALLLNQTSPHHQQEQHHHLQHPQQQQQDPHQESQAVLPTLEIAPSLEVTSHTEDLTRSSRSRRQTPTGQCSGALCCRHRITISFADVGWDDWIAAPSRFNAFFCKGACPFRYKSVSTFSQIKSLFHEKRPGLIPGPVCAATGHNSLEMLYYDVNGDLMDADYPGMIVNECRCI